jgi:hypothetical protein
VPSIGIAGVFVANILQSPWWRCSQSLSDASRIISTAANHFGSLPRSREDKGTFKVLTTEDCAFLAELLKDNPTVSLTEARRRLAGHKIGREKAASFSTIARYLSEHGFDAATRKRLKNLD